MPRDTGAFENNCWAAGRCMFQQLAVDGNIHTRTLKHTRTSQDMLHVFRYVSGGADGRCASLPFTNRPGSIVIHDYARTFKALQATSVLHSLHIPHDLVGFDPETMPAQIVLDLASPQGVALNMAFDSLLPDLMEDPDYLEKKRIQRFADLIRAALPGPGTETHAASKMMYFIERHIKDHHLTQSSLQDEFQVSRAQIYGYFFEHGGFEAYVTLRRAFNAIMDLNENPDRRQKLAELAKDWGFASELDLKVAVATHYLIDLDTVF